MASPDFFTGGSSQSLLDSLYSYGQPQQNSPIASITSAR